MGGPFRAKTGLALPGMIAGEHGVKGPWLKSSLRFDIVFCRKARSPVYCLGRLPATILLELPVVGMHCLNLLCNSAVE